ncbi:MAG: SufD family Fe-S cluster assembly protein [Deltaproteobacteria bacterium]|nr:SufD family Fe-S cluster assembly protein [Deltaproteobacteria bacterium]
MDNTIAVMLLPEWKRLSTKSLGSGTLGLPAGTKGRGHDAYVRDIAQRLGNNRVVCDTDGYLSHDGLANVRTLSVEEIDAVNDRKPSGIFDLLRLDTHGRGKFHSMDESFLRMDRAYAKGFSIHVKSSMEEPIVELVRADRESRLLVHHDLIVLEPGVHLVMLRVVEGRETSMIADNTEVYAGSGSRLEYITVNRSGKGAFYTAIKQARVSERAAVDWYTIDLTESNVATSTRSTLAGAHAESRMTGVFTGRGESQKDISYETFHTAPDTVTSVLVRAAVLDRAKVIYRALTHIASGSKRARVEQTEKSIMLGEQAQFNGIPSLWIDEDDVTASHSASSGMVDEQAMFYMKSRGISHRDAERLITEGFISSLLNREPMSLLNGLQPY